MSGRSSLSRVAFTHWDKVDLHKHLDRNGAGINMIDGSCNNMNQKYVATGCVSAQCAHAWCPLSALTANSTKFL